MNTQANNDWVARSLASVWHPCTQMQHHESIPMVSLSQGRGAWLMDHAGHRYIDGISSWWVNLFGHANPRINQALKEQLDQLEHAMLAGFTHRPVVELSERLNKLTGLGHCFYASDGASATEIALKMSFHYWQNVGRPRKTRFVTLSNSNHGETLGALAVGNVELYKAIYRPLLMDVITVNSPDAYQRAADETAVDVARRRIAEIATLFADRHDEIAAIIVEPLVQCAGSMRMYDAEFLVLLRELCDRHDIHLIADEIAVGFGRTGKLFACEHAGITPDFLCLSKGLTAGYMPMSVVLTTDMVYQAFYDEYTKLNAFLHSHSYAGNPLACAAALASLELFDNTRALETNASLAAHLSNAAQNAFEQHPNVAEIRQCGMILAVEFVRDRERREAFPWRERRHLQIHRHALERGVLLRPLGNVIYFMPPYIVTPSEIELMVAVAREGLDLAVA